MMRAGLLAALLAAPAAASTPDDALNLWRAGDAAGAYRLPAFMKPAAACRGACLGRSPSRSAPPNRISPARGRISSGFALWMMLIFDNLLFDKR